MKRFLCVILSLIYISVHAQNIAIQAEHFFNGMYGKGSSISVPVKLDGIFKADNRFELYLSDENGGFSNQVKIGEYKSFFTPFVNGVIPATIDPGSGYKLKVRSTSPVVETITPAFEIVTGDATPFTVSSEERINDSTFGFCNTILYTDINLEVSGSNEESSIILDSTFTKIAEDLTPRQVNFSVVQGNYYSVQVRTSNDNNIWSIRTYLVLASTTNLGLQNSGSNEICLPAEKEYTINTSANNGISNNYPGTLYTISWGDGSITSYTHAELISRNGSFTHLYQKNSCGQDPINTGSGTIIYNAFKISIEASNICPAAFTPTTTYTKIWEKPKPEFTYEANVCVKKKVRFASTSFFGSSAPNNAQNCIETATYRWYVNNVPIPNANNNNFLDYEFETPGTYNVRLSLINFPCNGEVSHTVCVEPQPVPNFKMNNGQEAVDGCMPLDVSIENLTGTGTCQPFEYKWDVLYNDGSIVPVQKYTIEGEDINPKFRFPEKGEYFIRMTVKNSCGSFTIKRSVKVYGNTEVKFPEAARYCGKNIVLDFSKDVKPIYSSPTPSDKFEWIISGGKYSFINGTTASDPYPQIQFEEYGTYTISVSYTNNCGTSEASQQITFDEQPKVDAGPEEAFLCYSDYSINLQGTSTGPLDRVLWTTDGSGFFSTGTSLETTYFPGIEDKNRGYVQLTLKGIKKQGSACADAIDAIRVNIKEQLFVTSDSKEICSGTAVSYTPQGNGSSYTWTATVRSGTVNGYNLSGIGDINDVITNTGKAEATIVYSIIPVKDNCAGEPANLVVTILPVPDLTVPGNLDLCSNSNTGQLDFSSSVDGAVFNWTNDHPSIGLNASGTGKSIPGFTVVNTGTDLIIATINVTPVYKVCTAPSSQFRITVKPRPATPTVISPVTYCSNNEPISLSATPLDGHTLTWYDNSELKNGSSQPPVPPSTAGTFIYYVTQTNTYNCTSDAAPITVTVSPVITNNVISGSQILCLGTAAAPLGQSTGIVSGGNNRYTYQWQSATVDVTSWQDIAGEIHETYSPGALSKTTKFRRIVNSGPCTSISNEVTITVQGVLTDYAIASNQVICEDETPAMLDGQTPSGGNGTFNYQWQTYTDNGIWIPAAGTNNSEDYIPPALKNTTLYRRLVTSGECEATSQPVTITVNQRPNGTINTAASAICEYDEGSVLFTATTGTAPFTVRLSVLTPSGQVNTISQTINNNAGLITAFPASSVPGNYTITLNEIADKYCKREGDLSSVNIIVKPKPEITIDPVTPICFGSEAVLTVKGASTYSWNPSVGASSVTGSTVTVKPTNTTIYGVTGTTDGCAATSSVTVTVNPRPAPPITGPTLTYCLGNEAKPLTATVSDGHILTWYNGIDLSGGSNIAPTPSTASSGTSNYYVTQTNSFNCSSDAAVIQVIVSPGITENEISGEQTICAGNTPSALFPTSAIAGGSGSYGYQWQQLSTGETNWIDINGATSPSYTPSALNTTTKFRRVVTSGKCSSQSNVVIVSVQEALADYEISQSQVICEGSTPALLTSVQSPGSSGTFNYLWEVTTDKNNINSWQPINGQASESYQPGPLSSTSYFRRKVTNGVCSAYSQPVAIIVNPIPVISQVADLIIGNSVSVSEISFHSTPSSGVTYTWTNDNTGIGLNASGSGNLPSFNAINQSNLNVPVSGLITVLPVYSRQGKSCTGTATSFTITVLPTIAVDIIEDKIVCTGSTIPSFTPLNNAGQLDGSAVSYSWHVSGTGISLLNGSGTQIPSYNAVNNGTTDLLATITVTPKYTYKGVTTDGNPMSYKVTVKPATPAANAGPDVVLCGSPIYTMKATLPGSAKGLWTQIDGVPVSIANPIQPDTKINDLQPSNMYTFKWTLTGALECPSTEDVVVITMRSDLTQANAGNDIHFCDLENSGFVRLNANKDVSRTYEATRWSVISKPVGSVATFSNVSDPKAVMTFDKAGIYQLQWSIANDAGCEPSRDIVEVFVYDKVVAGNITGNTNVCQGTDVELNLGGYIGDIYKWQYNPAPVDDNVWIDASFTGSKVNFSNVKETFAVRAIVRSPGFSNGCTSDATTNVILINVAPVTDPGTTSSSATVCKESNNGRITLSGNTGSIIRWEYSEDKGVNWKGIDHTGDVLTYSGLLHTRWYRAVVKSGVCGEMASSHTVITVIEPVTLADAGQDTRYCNAAGLTLNGNNPKNGETGLWSQVAGKDVVFSSRTSPVAQIIGLQPGTYTFEWTLSNGVCADSKDQITIIIDPQPANDIQTTPQTICFGQTVIVTGLSKSNDDALYKYQWQTSDDGNSWINVQGSTDADLSFAPQRSVYVRRVLFSASCTLESLPVHITVLAPVTKNTISSDQGICLNTVPKILQGSQPEGGNGSFLYQWQMSTGTVWTDINGETSIDYAPPALSELTRFRRIVRSDVCNGSQSSISNEVVISINPGAKASFTQTVDESCAPFAINSSVIHLQPANDRNSGYEWYADDKLIGTSSNFPGYTISTDGTDVIIRLKAISKYGCADDQISHTFRTLVNPKASFTISETEGCGPLTVQVNNTTPSVSLFTYRWDFGNGQSSTLTQPGSITFQPNPLFVDTVYTIKLWAYSQCETTLFEKQIKVKSAPMASFAPNRTIGCSPMPVTFTNTSMGLGINYTWDLGDGTVINTTSADDFSHEYHTGVHTTLHVMLKAENECGADEAQYDLVISPNTVKLDFAVNGTEENGCAPHTVHFRNNSRGASGFRWDFGDGTIVNTVKNIDTVTHVFLTSGEYQVHLYAFNGCSDTSSVETVKVHLTPKANFNINEYTVCLGDTIRPVNHSENATSYLWDFGNGTGSDLRQPTFIFKEIGTYTVKLNALRANESGAVCLDSTLQEIQVVASQKGWFDVSDSVGSCAPFTVTFTNKNIPAKTANWDFGDGESGTGNVVTHTFTKAGTYLVKLTVLVPGGCTYITERTISVNGPDGTITYEGGYICNDAAVRFEATPINTDSIRWDFGDGKTLTTTQRIVYHNYEFAGSYVPVATLMNNGKCPFVVRGVEVIKVDKLNAGFTISQDMACGTTTLQFRDTGFVYSGKKTVEWRLGDGTSNSGQSFSHDYKASGDYVLQQIVTGKSGCSDTLQKTVNIQVNAIPVATIDAVKEGCSNKDLQFNANIQSPDSIKIIQWNTSNSITGNRKQFTVNFDQPSGYDLQLIAGTVNGCYDTATHHIQVNLSPKVDVNDDLTLCREKSVQLNATGADSYTWLPQQGLSCTDCNNPVATPLTTTPYVVKGLNNNGCFDYDTVVVSVIQPMQLHVSDADSICIGTKTQLLASGADLYEWSPASGLSTTNISNPLAAPVLTTNYRVIGYDRHNCFTDTAYVKIAVGNQVKVSLGPDQVLSTGTLFTLKPVIQNGPVKKWIWEPVNDLSCTNCPNPVATIKRDAAYIVSVTSNYNCTASDTILIKTFCESSQVFVPNAFTPDGDGINDIMMVRAKGIAMVKTFRIYNRWGETVFERNNFAPNNPAYGWNGMIRGKAGGPDVYVYTAEVICENGTTYTYRGNISLIR